MAPIDYGWHMPSFPTDGSAAGPFLDQLHANLATLDGGFTSVWVDDHVHPWGSFVPRTAPATEVMTTLATFAARYPAFDWGSLVLCQSYRNPALVAKMAASLQWLTGGRYIFGIGAGWFEEEYAAYDWPFPRAAVRIAQMAETIEIARRMWTQSPATFQGDYYRIEGAYCEPRPDPLPPVMVGGGGEQLTLRVVARLADWWNLPGGTVETYAHKLDVLRRHCAEVGRPYDAIRKTVSLELIAVAGSEDEARRQAAACPYNRGNAIAGTAPQVAAELRRYLDLGVDLFMLRLADFPATEGLARFQEEVIARVG